MNRKVDVIMLKEFIENNFESYLEFSKKLGISYSHLYYILQERILISENTIRKFKCIFGEMGVDFNDFLVPLPITLGKEKISQIDIFNESNELLCSISSENIIYEDGIKVMCRPY